MKRTNSCVLSLCAYVAAQRALWTKALVRFALLGCVSLWAGTAGAIDITTDTTINADNVSTYTSAALAVSENVTLTIELAPTTADQTFSGAISGAGKIDVKNTGAKVVRFSGSFKDFTGTLTATGDVRIGSTWNNVNLNGSVSGLTRVEGAAGKTITFYGKDVFGASGAAINPGHQSTPKSTIDFNSSDQTVSLLTFMGCAYAESHSSYSKPIYTLKSDTAATLTVKDAFCWATSGGTHPTDHTGEVKVNGALSLVFNGTSDAAFAFHGESTTTGGLTVKAGEITIAEDASFSNLSSLTATGTGSVVLETTAVNAANLALEIADTGKVTLSNVDVFRVNTLKVDDAFVAPDEYTAEEIAALTGSRLTGAAVVVLTREITEKKTFTWTGAGTDDSLATAENWSDSVAPALKGGDEMLVFPTGTSVTVPENTDIYGIQITATGDFTLKGEKFRLGVGGLTCAATDAARTCTFEATPRLSGEQKWSIPSNTVVKLASGWAGHAAVTLVREAGTGDILEFSSNESPAFAGSLTVPGDAYGGNILVLSGRGGIGASGASVQLNGKAGVRATATCVTNNAAITFYHGSALNLAPAGVEFVQFGALTNMSQGAYSSGVAVSGVLRVNGGLGEASSHQTSPKSYEWWVWRFAVNSSGKLWIGESPIAVGNCPFRLDGNNNSSGEAHLAATGSAYGALSLHGGVEAICEGENVLASSGDVAFYYLTPGSLDLNGYDQIARDVLVSTSTGFVSNDVGKAAMYVTSASPATLKLTGSETYVPNNLNFRDKASLHYAGTGKLAMTNTASTTVGSLTVSGGEVALLAGATWANCTNVVVSGTGKLTLDASVVTSGAFSSEATLSVSDSGAIEIPEGQTLTVKYLYRDGEPTYSGQYSDGFVTGGGTLKVRRSSRKSGFLLLVR